MTGDAVQIADVLRDLVKDIENASSNEEWSFEFEQDAQPVFPFVGREAVGIQVNNRTYKISVHYRRPVVKYNSSTPTTKEVEE